MKNWPTFTRTWAAARLKLRAASPATSVDRWGIARALAEPGMNSLRVFFFGVLPPRLLHRPAVAAFVNQAFHDSPGLHGRRPARREFQESDQRPIVPPGNDGRFLAEFLEPRGDHGPDRHGRHGFHPGDLVEFRARYPGTERQDVHSFSFQLVAERLG